MIDRIFNKTGWNEFGAINTICIQVDNELLCCIALQGEVSDVHWSSYTPSTWQKAKFIRLIIEAVKEFIHNDGYAGLDVYEYLARLFPHIPITGHEF